MYATRDDDAWCAVVISYARSTEYFLSWTAGEVPCRDVLVRLYKWEGISPKVSYYLKNEVLWVNAMTGFLWAKFEVSLKCNSRRSEKYEESGVGFLSFLFFCYVQCVYILSENLKWKGEHMSFFIRRFNVRRRAYEVQQKDYQFLYAAWSRDSAVTPNNRHR